MDAFVIPLIAVVLIIVGSVVGTLGLFGTLSSLFVLVRNQAGNMIFRLLIGLTVADAGVLVSLFLLITSWIWPWPRRFSLAPLHAYRYFYFCSIYLTVLLSLDRYLVTSRPVMMRRINYKNLQRRLIASVFAVVLPFVVPDVLGHDLYYNACSHHEVYSEGTQQNNGTNQTDFLTFLCNSTDQCLHEIDNVTSTAAWKMLFNFGQNCSKSCIWSTSVLTPSDPLKPLKRYYCEDVGISYHGVNRIPMQDFENCYMYSVYHSENSINIHALDFVIYRPLWHNAAFRYGYFFGIVIPFMYALPSLVILYMLYVNIRLVRIVRKAHVRHSTLVHPEETANTGILKTVVAVAGIFLLLHTPALGADISWLVAAGSQGINGINYTYYGYLGVVSELLYIITGVLSAINSTVNVLIYCWFLPLFLWCCGKCRGSAPHDNYSRSQRGVPDGENSGTEMQNVTSQQTPQIQVINSDDCITSL